jgi:hypothetical protein
MPVQTFQPVTPHIYRLEQPFLAGRFRVNVWLVRDADGWLMVDAGAPGFEKKLLEQVLVQTGGEKPRMLLLTHGHTDHAAAAQRIREEWKIPIAAHRDEIKYLIGPARYASIKAKNPIYMLLQISAPPLVGRNVQMPLDDGSKVGDLIRLPFARAFAGPAGVSAPRRPGADQQRHVYESGQALRPVHAVHVRHGPEPQVAGAADHPAVRPSAGEPWRSDHEHRPAGGDGLGGQAHEEAASRAAGSGGAARRPARAI